MKSYHNIETETKYGAPGVLPSGKTYREKYRVAYGANGELYYVKKRGGKWEATCRNPEVSMKQYLLTARTLDDMSKLLSELKKEEA